MQMSTINLEGAARTLSSPSFLKSAVMIVAGSLMAQVLTSYLRNNVYDVKIKGGDAVYALVAGMLSMALLPGKYGRPIALGSTASAVRTVASEYGIV